MDGGVSDNVGMHAVLDALEIIEALHETGLPSPLDGARRYGGRYGQDRAAAQDDGLHGSPGTQSMYLIFVNLRGGGRTASNIPCCRGKTAAPT